MSIAAAPNKGKIKWLKVHSNRDGIWWNDLDVLSGFFQLYLSTSSWAGVRWGWGGTEGAWTNINFFPQDLLRNTCTANPFSS